MNTASSIAAVATRTAISGGSFGDNFQAEIPNIIGNIISTTTIDALRECFVAGTPVHTPDGLRAIETLLAGDLVWARSDSVASAPLRSRRVVRTFRTDDRETFLVRVQAIDGTIENIRTTPAHPFAVMLKDEQRSKGPNGSAAETSVELAGKSSQKISIVQTAPLWKQAQHLEAGDLLCSQDGAILRVHAAGHDGLRETVFNFEVEEDHTYYVGEHGTWVHNESQRRSRIGTKDQPTEEDYLQKVEYKKVQITRGTFGKKAELATAVSYTELGEDLDLKLAEIDPDYKNDFDRTRYYGFMNKTVPYEAAEIDYLLSKLSNHVDNHSTSWTPPFYETASQRGRSYQGDAANGRVFEISRFRAMGIQHQQKMEYIGAYLSQAFTPGGVAMGAAALSGFDRDIQMAAGGMFNLVLAVGSLRVGPNLKASGLQAPNPPPLLPKFQPGDKTVGVLRTSIGDVPLSSGWAGPSSAIPRGSPGFDIVSKSHVEGHAAALMRQEGIKEATLFINNTPCRSCVPNLPRMLPSGATLNVVLPDGSVARYVGK